ncbi:hypothetical protein KP79_PYT23039 [Mizuhopecten yessoensis]|uniref:Uncharacterized protein n=1 Tax=Mizuhopecten yessoensis TaxID=6573 RepID=A0A210PH90_MIZYE|nr:hypothetical protein KP79_PYT23039 [Mizuhopecten yessoensis]
METPIVYGQVEAQTVNGKHKLVTNLTPRVKVAVNRFEGNQGLYIHLNSRGKGISLSWEEYVDLCTLKAELDQKLHLCLRFRVKSTTRHKANLNNKFRFNKPCQLKPSSRFRFNKTRQFNLAKLNNRHIFKFLNLQTFGKILHE